MQVEETGLVQVMSTHYAATLHKAAGMLTCQLSRCYEDMQNTDVMGY